MGLHGGALGCAAGRRWGVVEGERRAQMCCGKIPRGCHREKGRWPRGLKQNEGGEEKLEKTLAQTGFGWGLCACGPYRGGSQNRVTMRGRCWGRSRE